MRVYEEDELGRRMVDRFIGVTCTQTVKEAMRTLVSQAADKENVSTIFVLDESGGLYGTIGLAALIVARSADPLASLIRRGVPFAYDSDRISEVASRLRESSEELLAVLSRETGKMLGVITPKEIIALLDEESGDDYAKLAAMTEESEPSERLLTSMRKRIPWLAALLLMGLGVSAVVGFFRGVIDALPVIVSFQSLILGMAGNVGTQSLAVTVRSLGDGKAESARHRLSLALRELRIALLGGAILGGVSALVGLLYLLAIGSAALSVAFSVAVCVGLSMCFAMAIAGLAGAVIPLLLDRIGLDPAVASGPLITTVSDLFAVVGYYSLARVLLP